MTILLFKLIQAIILHSYLDLRLDKVINEKIRVDSNQFSNLLRRS